MTEDVGYIYVPVIIVEGTVWNKFPGILAEGGSMAEDPEDEEQETIADPCIMAGGPEEIADP